MREQYVVTFIGDDRTGISGELSEVIARHEGNWLESRLSQLEGKFAGLILISLDQGNAETLEAELAALPGGNWSARVTPAGQAANRDGSVITLSVMGPDRLGIVKGITAALAELNISVQKLDTSVESAAFTGEPIFRARIEASAPAQALRPGLEERLDNIADEMTLEIDLEG